MYRRISDRALLVRVRCFSSCLCRRCPQHQCRNEGLDKLPRQPEALEYRSADYRRYAIRAGADSFEGQLFLVSFGTPPSHSNFASQKFQAQLTALTESLADAPIIAKSVILHSYARLAEMYLNASEGRRAGYGIAAVNVGIWIAWQIPVLRPFMMSHFVHHPLSGKTYTMLTSMFR